MPAAPKNVNILKGSRVVVLGGTSGIGYAVASSLIEEGVEVIVSSSTPAKVEAAVKKLADPETQYNGSASLVSGHALDLSAGPETEARLVAFFDKIGAFDHLIYTAGDSLNPKGVSDVDYEHIITVGGVRFVSAILAVKAGLKKQKNGGSIILTGGLAGAKPVSGWTLISAYSTAFEGLIRGLALDLSPRNIRVNLVSPGAVKTELWDPLPQGVQDFLLADAAKKLTGKAGTPEELAQSYLYLLKSTNVTGEAINSDSGARLGEKLSA